MVRQVAEGHLLDSWQEAIPVTGSVILPPDPRMMEAVGANHALESALADLIDNSIDAKADRVLIRFVIVGGQLKTLYVIDNGRGMTESQLNAAMTMGGERNYDDTDLGHFGWGLKAASLSQADSLTVLTRAHDSLAQGRRWLASRANKAFECDVVAPAFAEHELSRDWGYLSCLTGTIIRWDAVRVFPAASDRIVTDRYLQNAVLRLQTHLGLTFGRFIAPGRLSIAIDVEDLDALMTGAPYVVTGVDPFGYLRTGRSKYPKTLLTDLGGTEMKLQCHVWPARSQLPQFKLGGSPPESSQGFYFYRRDRLLQAGGWNNVDIANRELQLARVQVDIDDALVESKLVRMNPEKTRVEAGTAFGEAVRAARSVEGVSFADYIEEARDAFKGSNKRRMTRPAVAPPGRGFHPRIKAAIAQELPFLPNEEPIDIRWADLPVGSFMSIDRDTRTIWLNRHYRRSILGNRASSLNDAPMLKTLLYITTQSLFHGAYWGQRDKDNAELWHALLDAAAEAES